MNTDIINTHPSGDAFSTLQRCTNKARARNAEKTLLIAYRRREGVQETYCAIPTIHQSHPGDAGLANISIRRFDIDKEEVGMATNVIANRADAVPLPSTAYERFAGVC